MLKANVVLLRWEDKTTQTKTTKEVTKQMPPKVDIDKGGNSNTGHNISAKFNQFEYLKMSNVVTALSF